MSETPDRRGIGLTDTSRSPFCRLRPVPLGAVRVEGGLWGARIATSRSVSIPTMLERLREHGVLDNFLRSYGAKECSREERLATDSDLYKWIEAACYALANRDDPELREAVEAAVDVILPAQEASGYLNTSMVEERRERRWRDFHAHELYCAGHMFQAAVAHHRATGEKRFLDAACRFADYLCDRFGGEDADWYPGHPEVELALVELFRETRTDRYRHLAGRFLKRNPHVDPDEIWGHAVRALYYDSGAADYYAESGDPDLLRTLEAHWRTLTAGKMYVTGGVGSRFEGEMLGEMYELPNLRAYAETCAAAANLFWNWRMLALGGEARFADLVERTLYNGFLAGVSLDGLSFFYVNPLACTGSGQPDPWYEHIRRGPYQRQGFFHTTCCPPNVLRVLAGLPGCFYSTSDEGVWVHLYGTSTLDYRLPGGPALRIRQVTDYPWAGGIEVRVEPETASRFSVFLRVPGWCPSARAEVNGRPAEAERVAGTYLQLEREWRPGDRINLSLDMPVVFVACDRRVAANRGRVALQRGPLIYCLESPDNPDVDLFRARVDASTEPTVTHREDLLGGITVIKADGAVPTEREPSAPLYRAVETATPPELKQVTLTAIPYYAWANRGPAQMAVWLQRLNDAF